MKGRQWFGLACGIYAYLALVGATNFGTAAAVVMLIAANNLLLSDGDE